MESMQSLMSLAERCNVGLHGSQAGSQNAGDLNEQREEEGGSEERLRREVDLLQSYSELVRGMSGYVGGLVLLAGVPDGDAVSTAHSQGNPGGDMAPHFPALKSLCSFVPSDFSGGVSSQLQRDMASVSGGLRHLKVSDHLDVTSDLFSSSRLPSPRGHTKQQQLHVRGRQNSSNDDGGGSSVRMSRSLSPNNSRNCTTSWAVQGDVCRAMPARHCQQHSVVSDLLTMFAEPERDRLHDNKSSQFNSEMYVEGSVLIRNASNLSEDMSSFARGGCGLRVWYPLLIMDAPRQVATLRILASLLTSSDSVRSEFEALSMSSVLLYCMYVTPLLASEASLQVLFDLATSPSQPHTQLQMGKHESIQSIHRVEFLKLSVQIATSSPLNIQLSLCTVEWLIGLCDDSLENIAKVLDEVGIAPFLLMLSLWLKCEDMQLGETDIRDSGDGDEESSSSCIGGEEGKGRTVSEYTVRMPCVSLTVDEKKRILSSSRGVFNDSIYADQPKKLAKLQVTIARFLKLLITGTNGELPPLRVAAASQTPSGFSVSHLQALLHFIAYTME